MIDFLKKFLAQADAGGAEAAAPKEDPVRRATAVLMVKAALRDGAFEENERKEIEATLHEEFGMTDAEIEDLLAETTEHAEDSIELYSITRTLKDGLEYEDRVNVLEILWRVAYADGELDAYEDQLIRSVGGLLYVEDRDRGAARKRAMASLGLSDA